MPKVTTIPATRNIHTDRPLISKEKQKVCSYARVSTDSDEQYTSYEAQVDYYTKFIKSHDDWEFVKVYTDEGISGLNTKNRDGFNEMIADALAGKFDLIITKSVSRFARNTVDSLSTIRMLKEKHVEVYFEKENIWTFDSKGELLITIMSSLAQEESRSLSENVTWGQRKSFSDGKVHLPYKTFLGYEKGEDGLPKIVPEEAEIVKRIYRLFLEGKTPSGIAQILNDEGIPRPGRANKWSSSTILSILQNEKYKGDALLQKTFTVDFLTKKTKVNEGEVPQYYVENSHPAIISREDWDRVQTEIERRKGISYAYSGSTSFSCKIVCGCCGGYFGQKVWHSTDKYRTVIWQCNNKFKAKTKCTTPHFSEDAIKERFLQAYTELIGNRDFLCEDIELVINTLTDTAKLDEAIEKQTELIAELTTLVSRCIEENATTAQSQEAYLKKYESLVKRHENALTRLKELQSDKRSKEERMSLLGQFLADIKAAPLVLTEWDETLWTQLIDFVKVYPSGKMDFHFRNGTAIQK